MFLPDSLEPRDRGILIKSDAEHFPAGVKPRTVAIFSSAFHMYSQNLISEQEAKVYLSSNILRAFVDQPQSLIQHCASDYVTGLDEQLRETFDYLSYKYPNAPINNKMFAVEEIDDVDTQKNNYLVHSHVVFEYRQSGIYNDYIMRIINQLHEKIHSKQNLQLLKSLSPSNIQFGLSGEVPPFTDKEIRNLHLEVKTAQIYKFLRNWVKQLLPKFMIPNFFNQKPQNNHLPNMKKVNNLQFWMRQQLNEEMDKQRGHFQQFYRQVNQKVHADLLERLKSIKNCEEDEVAIFALRNVEILHNSTLELLNRLIHGLMSVSLRFYKRQELSSSAWPEPPNLLTLRPYSLLKFRAFTQNQFTYANYENILTKEISKQSSKLATIKIQDRTQTFYKDIAITLRLNSGLFAVASFRSTGICEFNKRLFFNKVIEKFRKPAFGPILQLSQLWGDKDNCMDYYRSKHWKEVAYHQGKQHIIKNRFSTSIRELLKQPVRCTKNFPPHGVCAIIPHSDKAQLEQEIFSYFNDGNHSFILTKDKNGGLKKVQDISTENKFHSFLKNYFVFGLASVPEEFVISQNQIKKQFILPEYVKNCLLKCKETISLIKNDLTDEECDKILNQDSAESKKHVKNLFLTDNNITRVDFFTKSYQNIEWLQLNRTKVTDFRGIDQLVNLKVLILDRCEMTTLPLEICRLKKLQRMTISQSSIDHLPKEVAKLSQLYYLQLDFNKLQELPMDFFNCTSLTMLNIDGNNLKTLPKQFAKLVKIERLFLCSNSIEEIPEVIFSLTNLFELHLKGNKIKQISPRIAELSKLRILNLSKNLISQIPEELKSLQNLKTLNLSGNQIPVVPDWLKAQKIENLVID